MIPLLLVYVYKIYRSLKKNASRKAHIHLLYLAIVGLSCNSTYGQESTQYYDVLHHGDIKGKLILHVVADKDFMRIRLESDVTMHFLFPVNVRVSEEAVFQQGVLIFSSLKRWVNG